MYFKNNNFYEGNSICHVLGGELHYFRLEKQYWEARIMDMKEAGFTMVSTYVPWMIHEASQGHIDLVGDTYDNCDLRSFLELAKKHQMKVLLRPGPYVMSELVGSGIPMWLLQEYDQVRALDRHGMHHPVPELVCLHHPVFLEKVKVWYDALASVIKPYCDDSTISMIQLDNEVGMFCWVTHCPDLHGVMLERFKAYLIEQGITSNVLELADQPFRDAMYDSSSDDALILLAHYKYFERVYIKDYLVFLQQLLESHDIHTLGCINVHGFTQHDYSKRGTKYPIGLSQLQLSATIKNTVMAGDYYIGNLVYENMCDLLIANALTLSVQNVDQPLFSAEFQSGFQNSTPRLLPSTHDLKARLCFSQGMNAINYYMFCGGFNYRNTGLISDHHDWQAPISKDGQKRSSYYLLKQFNQVILAYGTQYLNSKPNAKVALLYSIDEYLTPYSNGSDGVDAQQQRIETFLFEGVGKYCTYQNIAIQAYDLADERPIRQEQAILVCSGYMNETAQLRVVEYLESNKKLLIYGLLPTHDFVGRSCTILQDYLNVKQVATQAYQSVAMFDEKQLQSNSHVCYQYGDDYAVVATSNNGDATAIIKDNVALMCSHVDMGFDYVQAAFSKLLAMVDITSDYTVEAGIQISSRSYDMTSFVHIMNVFDETITTTVQVQDYSLFDGASISVPARKALLLPMMFKVDDQLVFEYVTQEIQEIQKHDEYISVTFNMNSDEISYRILGQEPTTISNIYSQGGYTIDFY